MQEHSPAWRLSFQSKVLLPVILILMLLVGIMIAVTNQRLTSQAQAQAARELARADVVLKNSQAIRSRNLLLRYRNVPNEPRFKAVSQLGDAKTLSEWLSGLLKELGGDVALSTT